MFRFIALAFLLLVGCAYGVADPEPTGHGSTAEKSDGGTSSVSVSITCAEQDGAVVPCFGDGSTDDGSTTN